MYGLTGSIGFPEKFLLGLACAPSASHTQTKAYFFGRDHGKNGEIWVLTFTFAFLLEVVRISVGL